MFRQTILSINNEFSYCYIAIKVRDNYNTATGESNSIWDLTKPRKIQYELDRSTMTRVYFFFFF